MAEINKELWDKIKRERREKELKAEKEGEVAEYLSSCKDAGLCPVCGTQLMTTELHLGDNSLEAYRKRYEEVKQNNKDALAPKADYYDIRLVHCPKCEIAIEGGHETSYGRGGASHYSLLFNPHMFINGTYKKFSDFLENADGYFDSMNPYHPYDNTTTGEE